MWLTIVSLVAALLPGSDGPLSVSRFRRRFRVLGIGIIKIGASSSMGWMGCLSVLNFRRWNFRC